VCESATGNNQRYLRQGFGARNARTRVLLEMSY
jgi:hypothetical protein